MSEATSSSPHNYTPEEVRAYAEKFCAKVNEFVIIMRRPDTESMDRIISAFRSNMLQILVSSLSTKTAQEQTLVLFLLMKFLETGITTCVPRDVEPVAIRDCLEDIWKTVGHSEA